MAGTVPSPTGRVNSQAAAMGMRNDMSSYAEIIRQRELQREIAARMYQARMTDNTTRMMHLTNPEMAKVMGRQAVAPNYNAAAQQMGMPGVGPAGSNHMMGMDAADMRHRNSEAALNEGKAQGELAPAGLTSNEFSTHSVMGPLQAGIATQMAKAKSSKSNTNYITNTGKSENEITKHGTETDPSGATIPTKTTTTTSAEIKDKGAPRGSQPQIPSSQPAPDLGAKIKQDLESQGLVITGMTPIDEAQSAYAIRLDNNEAFMVGTSPSGELVMIRLNTE